MGLPAGPTQALCTGAPLSHASSSQTCELLRISKSFCKCGIQLLILTTLEIKTKKMSTLVNLFKSVKDYLNNSFMRSNYFLGKKVRKGALFYILTNLSNVWLNRRQLDSLICFSSPSVAIIISGKNSTAHSQENESEKGK